MFLNKLDGNMKFEDGLVVHDEDCYQLVLKH